ncbi:MAG: cyclase family protein [Thermodesulfobacteriota bacterium]
MEPYLKDLLARGTVYDLGMPYFPGMPHHPNQPPFAYTLTKKHGDVTLTDQKVSFCNDLFVMGGHTGTHLDARAHVACRSIVYGNVDITDLQGYQDGLHVLGIDTTPPVIRRGVLLDIPRSLHLEVLPHDFGIGKEEMERAAEAVGVEIAEGDAVLVRTGWIRYWEDRQKYVSEEKGAPGVIESGAHYLAEKKAAYTGSDTTAYDRVPPHHLPCHVILLVQNGIQIMEMLNLEELSREGIFSFLFIALPLKIKGGAGSPIRPIAIA